MNFFVNDNHGYTQSVIDEILAEARARYDAHLAREAAKGRDLGEKKKKMLLEMYEREVGSEYASRYGN